MNCPNLVNQVRSEVMDEISDEDFHFSHNILSFLQRIVFQWKDKWKLIRIN